LIEHLSIVDASLSSQSLSFGMCKHPLFSSQLSTVHAIWSSQFLGVDLHPTLLSQLPIKQLLDAQEIAVETQDPVLASQKFLVHALLSEQSLRV